MEPLIDETFLARLANLKVIVKGRRKGKLAGPHPSVRAGVSVKFADCLLPVVAPRHGMEQMTRVVHAVERMPSAAKTSIGRALTEFVSKSHQSGLVFLLSDAGYEESLSRLFHRGDEVAVIQILDPEELRPTIEGSVLVTEVETAGKTHLAIGRETLALYERRLGAYLAKLRGYLSDHRVSYFLAPTDVPLEVLIHERLRAGGVLQ